MRSIQLKLIGILLVPFISIVFLTTVAVVGLNNIRYRSDLIHQIQERTQILDLALISLQDASSSLGFSSSSDADIQQIRNYEALFDNATFDLETYFAALYFGSESSEFKNYEGGEHFRDWSGRKFSQSYLLYPESENREALAGLLETQSVFKQEALKGFNMRKAGINSQETDQLIQTEKELLSNKTKELVEKNNKVVSENITAYKDLISKLYIILWMIAILATIIMMVGGIYFSHILVNKPIRALTKVATDISVGKLDATIDQKILDSQDEIGELARAFDRTLVSLKLAMKIDKSSS